MVTGGGWVKATLANGFAGTNRRQQANVHVYTEIVNWSAEPLCWQCWLQMHHNSHGKMLYFLVNIMLISLLALAAVNIAAMSH